MPEENAYTGQAPGMGTSYNMCVLCNREVETQDHIFFNCTYSATVWRGMLKQLKARCWTNNWQDIMDWYLDNSGIHWISKFHKDLLYFGLSAVVYEIRRERNQRFHQKIARDQQSAVKEVLQHIRFNATKQRLTGRYLSIWAYQWISSLDRMGSKVSWAFQNDSMCSGGISK